MSNGQTAQAIVAEATTSRAHLAELDHQLQDEIDAIALGAAKEKRALSDDEKRRRETLRAEQREVQEAFKALAFVTLARLDQSGDVKALKAQMDLVTDLLSEDLARLKDVARFAAIAAKVADGLAQLAEKVAALAAKGVI